MKKFSCFLKNSRKVRDMSEVYFVCTESLIMNILIAKAKIKQERIVKVSTCRAEITQICNYTSAKTGNRIVFESSSKDVLATIQQYPYRFVQNEQTKEILLSPSYHTKNRKKIEEIYAIPPKLTKCFRDFFKEKKRSTKPGTSYENTKY